MCINVSQSMFCETRVLVLRQFLEGKQLLQTVSNKKDVEFLEAKEVEKHCLCNYA